MHAFLKWEGSMNNNRNSDKTQPPTKLKLENAMDTSGRWFAVAVLFAVLVAGIIIYRAVNADIHTASNDIPSALASSSR
jgi:hypothetical protein